MDIACEYCGNVTHHKPSRFKKSLHHFCSYICKGRWFVGWKMPDSARDSIRQAKLRDLNPNWQCQATYDRKHYRQTYPGPIFCRICGKPAERHHKDGDNYNNLPDNIDFLCRKHHMEADGRLAKLVERNRENRS